MSLLLCHDCYSWVEPRGGHCPECLGAADLNEADPSLSRLHAILGDLTEKLGEISVRRRSLPDRGLLYATTKGLYFLPHTVEQLPSAQGEEEPAHTAIWALAASLWAPLYLFVLLFQSRPRGDGDATVYHPQLITPEQSNIMPELLMDNPGAFFVPSGSIHSIRRRLNGWVIERRPGRKLRFRSAAQRGAFDRKMHRLLASPPWRHVVQ